MLDFLNGYRTKLGAGALIASGVAIILQAVSEGSFDKVPEGAAMIGTGLTALGIRFAKGA